MHDVSQGVLGRVEYVRWGGGGGGGAAPFTVQERLEQCSGIICNGVHTLFWNSV